MNNLRYCIDKIKYSPGRFCALALIAALGAAIFTGLGGVSASMRKTVNAHFEDRRLAELRVISTLGISPEDVELASRLDGVTIAEGGFLAYGTAGPDGLPAEIRSLSREINLPLVLEGSLPENEREAAVGARLAGVLGIIAGDTLRLDPAQEASFHGGIYTVTAIVESPLYTADETGFVLMPAEAFTPEFYNELFILSDGGAELTIALAELGAQRAQLHYQDVVEQTNLDLEYAKEQYVQISLRTEQELEDAGLAVDQLRQQLEGGRETLDDRRAALEQERGELSARLAQSSAELESREAELNQRYLALNNQLAQVNEQQRQTDLTFAQAEEEHNNIRLALEETREILETQLAELDSLAAQIETLVSGEDDDNILVRLSLLYDEQFSAYDAALSDYEQRLENYAAGAQQLETEKVQTYSYLQSAREEINAGFAAANEDSNRIEESRQALEQLSARLEQLEQDSAAELEALQKKLERYQTDYARSLDVFRQMEDSAAAELRQAEILISDAEFAVTKIESGSWSVLDRTSFNGYSALKSEYERASEIIILPALFLAASALILLLLSAAYAGPGTEQDSKWANMTCGLAAGFIGGILGGLAGGLLIPRIVINALSSYALMDLRIELRAGGFAASALICAAAPALGAKLPSRPKNRRLRVLCGAACYALCAALIIAGLGSYREIARATVRQNTEIDLYDLLVQLDEDAPLLRAQQVMEYVKGESLIVSQLSALVRRMNIGVKTGQSELRVNPDASSAALVVPKDPLKLTEMIGLFDADTGEAISLPETGAVVTEKLALALSLSPGSQLVLSAYNGDSMPSLTVTVAAITENREGDYIYLPAADYMSETGGQPQYNCLYLRAEEANHPAIIRSLFAMSAVSQVSRDSETDSTGLLNGLALFVIASAFLTLMIPAYQILSWREGITVNS